jgi:hypothetical protein
MGEEIAHFLLTADPERARASREVR